MEDCLCQRLQSAHTHFINKARHSSAPTSQRAHQGTSRWSTRRDRLSRNAGYPVSESTLPTTEQQSCPHTDRAKSHNPAKHVLFSAPASGALLLLCPLPRGASSPCLIKGYFQRRFARPMHYKQWPEPLLLHPLRLHFFPGTTLSFHYTITCSILLLFLQSQLHEVRLSYVRFWSFKATDTWVRALWSFAE